MPAKSKVFDESNQRPWLIAPVPTGGFYVPETLWRFALRCAYKGKSVLFTGPTGCGKTSLAGRLADTLKRRLYSINMGATMDARSVLIGTTHFSDYQTHFVESRFVMGLQDNDGFLLLDEITRASIDAFNILMPVLDHQGYLSLDESDPPRIVQRCEGVRVFATANVGDEYTGTRQMDMALKDRFLILELDYPPRDAEIDILTIRKGCSKEDAEKLVDFAVDARNLWRRDELSSPVSTRLLLEAAESIVDGFSIDDSVEFTILNFFDATEGAHSDRTRLRQLLQRF